MIIFFLIRRQKRQEISPEKTELIPCPHRIFNREKFFNRGFDAYRFLDEWECDYCSEIIKESKDYPDNPSSFYGEISLPSLIENHLANCEKTQKIVSEIDAKKNPNLTYDNETSLNEKGYPSWVIRQIKSWGLINKVNLSNLKQKKRLGSVKILSVNFDSSGKIVKGWSGDLVVLMVPRATPIKQQNFSELLRDNKPDFFYTIHGSKNRVTRERVVAAFFIWRVLQEKGNWNYNIYVLENSGKDNPVAKYTPLSGISGDATLYLSLLSAYYQKPISQEVAATAGLEISDHSKIEDFCPYCLSKEIEQNPQENFNQVKVGPVDGLEHKVSAAIKAGVKKLILSAKQKENYEQVISPEIRKQLKVYYVKDIEELERLFWQGEFS